jgi:hypothetical protein
MSLVMARGYFRLLACAQGWTASREVFGIPLFSNGGP